MEASVVQTNEAKLWNQAAPLGAGRQLPTVREMLRTLDTLTTAGQKHTMAKIVGCLRAHAAASIAAERGAGAAAELAQLARHAERVYPDISTFVSRAEGLVLLLEPSRPG